MKERQTINLDVLVSGKLPDRVIDAIAEMELTIEEVVELEASRPKVRVTVEDGDINVDTHVCVSIKKALAVLGAVLGGAGGLWATAQAVLPNLLH
jgi:hypothetical protein